MTTTATLTVKINQVETSSEEGKSFYARANAELFGKPILIHSYGKTAEKLAQAKNQEIIANGEFLGGNKKISLKATQISILDTNYTNELSSKLDIIQQIIQEVEGDPNKIKKAEFIQALEQIKKVLV